MTQRRWSRRETSLKVTHKEIMTAQLKLLVTALDIHCSGGNEMWEVLHKPLHLVLQKLFMTCTTKTAKNDPGAPCQGAKTRITLFHHYSSHFSTRVQMMEPSIISMPPKHQTLRSDPRKFVEDKNFQNGPSLFMQYYSYVA